MELEDIDIDEMDEGVNKTTQNERSISGIATRGGCVGVN